MLNNQVEPRAAGEWFHCQVLNILWRLQTVENRLEVKYEGNSWEKGDKSESKSHRWIFYKTCKVLCGFILDIDLLQKIVNDKFWRLTTNCDLFDGIDDDSIWLVIKTDKQIDVKKKNVCQPWTQTTEWTISLQ